jgi:hypothetical protein
MEDLDSDEWMEALGGCEVLSEDYSDEWSDE